MVKKMICIANWDYEDCLTLGKSYHVSIESLDNNLNMYHVFDDNGEPLQSMIERFKEED